MSIFYHGSEAFETICKDSFISQCQKKILGYKENDIKWPLNVEVCPESLGAMSFLIAEYLIARLKKKHKITLCPKAWVLFKRIIS